MSDMQAHKAEIVRRLEALSQDRRQLGKVRARAQGLIDMMQAPARIGIFGLPGAGKRELLARFLDDAVDAEALPSITLHFTPGDTENSLVTLSDGTQAEVPGYPDPSLQEAGAIFATVSCPSCQDAAREYLMIAAEADPKDMSAGLNWATGRVDISIWCSMDWSAVEAYCWEVADAALKDHTILLQTGETRAPIPEFEHTVHIGDGPDALDQLLYAIISEAEAQNILAAEMFLRRYAKEAPQRPINVAQAIEQPADATTAPSPEARAELASLFNHVRNAPAAISTIADSSEDDSERVLEALEDVFEGLSERILDMDAAVEAWPDLEPTLEEARDFALLLRMEGGNDQIVDAAHLLLQLRCDMETKLAA